MVVVAASVGRTTADRRMNLAPDAVPPRASRSGYGSSGLISQSDTAEARKETASAASANGAVMSCTSSPPRLGPPTNDIARLP